MDWTQEAAKAGLRDPPSPIGTGRAAGKLRCALGHSRTRGRMWESELRDKCELKELDK